MALSSKLNEQKTPEEIGDELDALGKLIDRTKVMYEQYFMGIQRMAPGQLHRDIERRIREITQMQIRNTGLRFRFATLTQKFGSYNTYWKRTIRKIERGEYIRDVARAGRNAARRGVEVPDEVLAKVPERVRKRILRDREKMQARAAKDAANAAAASPAKSSRAPGNVHSVSEDDDLDLDSIFASLTNEEPGSPPSSTTTEFDEGPGSYRQKRPTPSDAPSAAKMPPLPARPPDRRGPAPPQATAPPAARSAPRQVAPPPGMSEREGRALFEKYAKARRLVGDKRPVSYEQLMRKLGKQAPKIMRDYNATGVGFNVVIKGEKVILKAKPKKGG